MEYWLSLWGAIPRGFWLSLWVADCPYGVLAVSMGCWMSLWGADCPCGVLTVPMEYWLSLWGAGCPYGVLAVPVGCCSAQPRADGCYHPGGPHNEHHTPTHLQQCWGDVGFVPLHSTPHPPPPSPHGGHWLGLQHGQKTPHRAEEGARAATIPTASTGRAEDVLFNNNNNNNNNYFSGSSIFKYF